MDLHLPAAASVTQRPSQLLSSQQQKPLSCTNCRARKLKCSREYPCHHCVRSGAECVIPARKRTRKPRKSKNSDLLQRLTRLESIVGKVGIPDPTAGSDVEMGESSTAAAAAAAAALNSLAAEFQELSGGSHRARRAVGDSAGLAAVVGGEAQQEGRNVPLPHSSKATQYLSSEFWGSLCSEVEGLRQALEQSTDSDDDDEQQNTPDSIAMDNSVSPSTVASALSPGMLLGNASRIAHDAIEHPPPDHIRFLTSVYFTNVDMILKILHRPTIEPALLALADTPPSSSSSSDSARLPPDREALFFSIYHAAIASLSPKVCLARLGRRRSELAHAYASALERALVRADYLSATSLEALQALSLYAACLRSTAGSRASWALLSLPVRLAHAMRLHRESANAGLPAYAAELRRRLWWQLIVLDIRASEDRGTTAIIARDSYDTKLPLNIDDADFGPESSGPLKEKRGPSDATFSLCTAQSSGIFLLAEHAQGGGEGEGEGEVALAPPQSVDETVQHARRLEAQFVAGADPDHAPSYLASTTVRLIILKLWLYVQYPLHARQRPPPLSSSSPSASLPASQQQQSKAGTVAEAAPLTSPPTLNNNNSAPIFPRAATLRTAVSIMELTEYLHTGPFGDRFTWWAATYVQWHPLAVALAELCTYTTPSTTTTKDEEDLVDRAWRIIDDVFPRWSEVIADTKSGTLWRPIRKLYKKAKAARRGAINTSTNTYATTSATKMNTSTDTTAAMPGDLMDVAGSVAGDTIHVRTDYGGPSNGGSNTTIEPIPAGGVYEMEVEETREPSVPPNQDKAAMSPYSLDESMMWGWRNFSMPLDLCGPSMMGDWGAWDDFVNDTQAGAEGQSKSASSEMSL
ncbi:fungal-specific transcription factor domain-containing protein [Hypoxylon fragiforme]|uniref:fungal-specific transcription factor domain-containing protein n=1 Tax=Hypoxylon fragiforme TaxID=63214 RepID=UPI0020C604FB|nr:fungal-specific transcription factor domain-containing protein [Hypoxylon fragiforme]KAI2604386.1 fungal-specific transcription factor domain-containing protein [Hypoxylon fragiforme]